MVCPRCTVLCVDSAVCCQHCGFPLRGLMQRAGVAALERTPAAIGIVSGVALICCLSIGILFPVLAGQALSVGAYFGIISIANTWLSVYRGDEVGLLRGMRGLVYCSALLFSLVGELARLQGVALLPLPALPGLPAHVPVPSAMATELLAGVLIVLDPLVVTPIVRWVGEGVVREEPA
jgi:hypothetical protein